MLVRFMRERMLFNQFPLSQPPAGFQEGKAAAGKELRESGKERREGKGGEKGMEMEREKEQGFKGKGNERGGSAICHWLYVYRSWLYGLERRLLLNAYITADTERW